MTLGTRKEAREEILETETYAFCRSHFPMEIQEHEVRILKNKFYMRDDGRLRVRILLECLHCYLESDSISETVPMMNTNKREMVILYSLSNFFSSDCSV